MQVIPHVTDVKANSDGADFVVEIASIQQGRDKVMIEAPATEDQAHRSFGEGAAQHRHRARPPPLPRTTARPNAARSRSFASRARGLRDPGDRGPGARSAASARSRRPIFPRGRRSCRTLSPEGEVAIAVVGKYTGLRDASLFEALTHGREQGPRRYTLDRSDDLEANGTPMPSKPARGPGARRLRRARRAGQDRRRDTTHPRRGICFGMQLAVIETARNRKQAPAPRSSALATTR